MPKYWLKFENSRDNTGNDGVFTCEIFSLFISPTGIATIYRQYTCAVSRLINVLNFSLEFVNKTYNYLSDWYTSFENCFIIIIRSVSRNTIFVYVNPRLMSFGVKKLTRNDHDKVVFA